MENTMDHILFDQKCREWSKYMEGCWTNPQDGRVTVFLSQLDIFTIKTWADIETLRNSGIVKIVKRYRKHEGKLGEKARELTSKWKKIFSVFKHEKKVEETKEEVAGLSFECVLNYDATPIYNESANKENNMCKKRKADVDPMVPLPPSKQAKVSIDDVDQMVSSLNQTSTDYQPMPRQRLAEPVKVSVESDAGIKSKTPTPVYSGRKRTASHQTVSHTQSSHCLAFLEQNISSFDCISEKLYDMMKPILVKVSATKLHALETVNPQLIGYTEELWMRFCGKDFRGTKPQECGSWRDLYWKKHNEREERLKSLTASISKGVDQKKDAVKKTKLTIVDVQAKASSVVIQKKIQTQQAADPKTMDPLWNLPPKGHASNIPSPTNSPINTPRPTNTPSLTNNPSSTPSPSKSVERAAPAPDKKKASKKMKKVAPLMAKAMRSCNRMRR
ncbi:hypothetical protein CAPTEDRAFT_189430 [Capitella teleta]|uniref:TFIIS N-terminal domain-containing protein n=1 Tax=Capitella teleta TaxID=283909 RepID=R7VGY3_CAPTE|nr:hypothetical protein CAPTEDRAFT_189430 [Capitella teleta]|eukprot:ELU15566.1 hypothetical protein CAPTEDRAFT_189430 [Capitella teleta]